ncbi:MAG: nucleotidyltransferase domain-containing protein [Planctomycetota bacterium]
MNEVSPPSRSVGLGIDPAVDRVRPVVHARLRQIEQDRGLRVFFACESGSRAWGFASDDSDFDVRFIFAYEPRSYLQLRPPTDAFDIHGDDEHDLDLAGWDIRKTAELMRKSNGPLFEWLDSPIVYEQDHKVTPRLIELRDTYFDAKKSVYHYLSLADGVWRKYLADTDRPVRKKYLYTLRPLACVAYIERHRRQPPTDFLEVLKGIQLPETVGLAIDRLVEDKKNNRELGMGDSDPVLNDWVSTSLIEGKEFAEKLTGLTSDTRPLDDLIYQTIMPPE